MKHTNEIANKKYAYKTIGIECAEVCKVLNNDTKIGSCACTDDCKHCIDHNDSEGWIVCAKIEVLVSPVVRQSALNWWKTLSFVEKAEARQMVEEFRMRQSRTLTGREIEIIHKAHFA